MTEELFARIPRYDEISLLYVENASEFRDFETPIDELARDFFFVDLKRRIAGPMAGGLFAEPAVIVAVGAASAVFLGELTKDVYKGLKIGLFALYRKAKTWANNRGYSPFAVVVTMEDGRILHFTFPKELTQEQFETALVSVVAAASSPREARILDFSYDTSSGWDSGFDPMNDTPEVEFKPE